MWVRIAKISIPKIALIAFVILVLSGSLYFSCTAFTDKRGEADSGSSTGKSVSSTNPVSYHNIIIDPGHGGMDGGAVGADGTPEKGINLAISLDLRDILVTKGFSVIMTRETDVSIYDSGAQTIRQQKHSDLMNRLAIANEHPDALYICIHQNSFPQTQYWGTQVFYGGVNAGSQPLAECIQSAVCEMLQPDNTRQIKPITSDVYIVYKAKNPAVLVECGFMTNANDLKKLESEDYQKQMAEAIADGIVAYHTSSSGSAASAASS